MQPTEGQREARALFAGPSIFVRRIAPAAALSFSDAALSEHEPRRLPVLPLRDVVVFPVRRHAADRRPPRLARRDRGGGGGRRDGSSSSRSGARTPRSPRPAICIASARSRGSSRPRGRRTERRAFSSRACRAPASRATCRRPGTCARCIADEAESRGGRSGEPQRARAPRARAVRGVRRAAPPHPERGRRAGAGRRHRSRARRTASRRISPCASKCGRRCSRRRPSRSCSRR